MSNFFSKLRAEAEIASAANKKIIFQSAQQRGGNAINHFSGKDAKSKMSIAGGGLGAGSFLGVMGVALANQAAALGSAGILASASTAMTGLGAVSIGAAVLPVATVATLGAAVAGVAILGASLLMNVDVSKGINMHRALERGDNASFEKLSKESLGLKDWFVGAKKVLADSFYKKNLQGLDVQTLGDQGLNQNEASKNPNQLSFAVEYELIDLFGESPAKDKELKKELATQLSEKIWNDHNIVVPEESIHSGLGNTRENEDTFGKIIGVDKEQGLVIQSIGRGRATIHKLDQFATEPKVGVEVSVSYRGGQMRNSQEKTQQQGIGR